MNTLTFIPKNSTKKATLTAYEDGMYKRFYIRFFDAELEADFLETVAAMKKLKAGIHMELEERNGTYMLKDCGWITLQDMTPWGMLFRKYLALSNDIRVDGVTSERYYPLMFSAEYIEPCARRLA